MKTLHVFIYCCFSVVCVEAVIEVSGHDVLYQVNLQNASTVPPGPPPATSTLQAQADSLPIITQTPTAEEKTSQQAPSKLTDTTVVIIVSVSLALLVCAIIPLIFYGHWRSNPEGQNKHEVNKDEADCYEQNAAYTQAAVQLQSLEPDSGPESSPHDDSQYSAAYEALDPQSLE